MRCLLRIVVINNILDDRHIYVGLTRVAISNLFYSLLERRHSVLSDPLSSVCLLCTFTYHLVKTAHAKIRLIDMGMSRVANPADTQYVVTRWYRAPEILLQEPYDEK